MRYTGCWNFLWRNMLNSYIFFSLYFFIRMEILSNQYMYKNQNGCVTNPLRELKWSIITPKRTLYRIWFWKIEVFGYLEDFSGEIPNSGIKKLAEFLQFYYRYKLSKIIGIFIRHPHTSIFLRAYFLSLLNIFLWRWNLKNNHFFNDCCFMGLIAMASEQLNW